MNSKKNPIDSAANEIIAALPADIILIIDFGRSIDCELFYGKDDTFIQAYSSADGGPAAILADAVASAQGFAATQCGVDMDPDSPTFKLMDGEQAKGELDEYLLNLVNELPPEIELSVTIGRGGWELTLMRRSTMHQRFTSFTHEPISSALDAALQSAKLLALGHPIRQHA